MTKHRAYDDPHHSDPEPDATEPGPDQGEQTPLADPPQTESDAIADVLKAIDAKIIASLGGGPPGSGIAALLGTCAAQLMGVAR
jgi:hypothetical protein